MVDLAAAKRDCRACATIQELAFATQLYHYKDVIVWRYNIILQGYEIIKGGGNRDASDGEKWYIAKHARSCWSRAVTSVPR